MTASISRVVDALVVWSGVLLLTPVQPASEQSGIVARRTTVDERLWRWYRMVRASVALCVCRLAAVNRLVSITRTGGTPP